MKSALLTGETTFPDTKIIPRNLFLDLIARRGSCKLINSLAPVLAAFIAIASFGSATVKAAGCGGANFTQATGSPISVPGNSPAQVVVADFNLDGKPDIAVTPTSATTGSVYLGNGNGGFDPAKPFAAIGSALAVADFNSDGKPDLVSLSRSNSGNNKITILLGDGTGNFNAAPGSPFTPANAADFLTVGDFNLDGKPDLAVTNGSGASTVRVMLGNGSGGFSLAGSPIAGGISSRAIVTADLNLDGKLDLMVPNQGSSDLTVLLGDGTGGFSPAPGSPVGTTQPDSIVIGDFNLDGKPDVALGSDGGFKITTLLGDGTGGFTLAPGSPKSFVDPLSLGSADLDLDGFPDLAVATDAGIVILSGDGNGRFTQTALPITVGVRPVWVEAGDFNLDGRSDFVTANFDSRDISIELNTCSSGGSLQFSAA